MRTIHKEAEPRCLVQHRCQTHAGYGNFAGRDALRQALVAEQRGLCCYCQSRIRPTNEGMKIEHWQCQADHPDKALDYSNLLGACRGNEGRPHDEQHCDSRKGNAELCFSVCDPAHPIERRIKFLGDGRLDSDEDAVRLAINDVLNLNLPRLVSNRKAVLDAFKDRLRRSQLDAARELKRWDGSAPGDLPPYAQVMVYWLSKRLSGAGAGARP